jgi:hypothetical protein
MVPCQIILLAETVVCLRTGPIFVCFPIENLVADLGSIARWGEDNFKTSQQGAPDVAGLY